MNLKRYFFKREALTNITSDIAQVVFAGMFIEEFLQNNVRWNAILVGFILSASFWFISLRFAKR